jgi:hypothetical protein
MGCGKTRRGGRGRGGGDVRRGADIHVCVEFEVVIVERMRERERA